MMMQRYADVFQNVQIEKEEPDRLSVLQMLQKQYDFSTTVGTEVQKLSEEVMTVSSLSYQSIATLDHSRITSASSDGTSVSRSTIFV